MGETSVVDVDVNSEQFKAFTGLFESDCVRA
jgi:hypothetical protein